MPSTDGDYRNLELNPYTVAENRGLVVVTEQEDLLMLDIDTNAQMALFEDMLDWPQVRNRITDMRIVPSNSHADSPSHKHIYCRLTHGMPIGARLSLQASMGSDPKRNMMDTLRLIMGIDTVPINVLFETPAVHLELQEFLSK